MHVVVMEGNFSLKTQRRITFKNVHFCGKYIYHLLQS